MEQVNFGYSLKNTPIPDEKTYRMMLISSLEKGLKNMQWAAFFFLNPDKSGRTRNTFGLPSSKPAPNLPELQEFKAGLLDIAKNVEFNKKTNPLQQKMKSDIKTIKDSDKVYFEADKTTNYYKVTADKYKELLNNNVTQDYKKAPDNTLDKMNKKDKKLATKLDIEDRMYQTVQRESHITGKDHKENFRNNPKCRLINPTKPEIGKVSRSILQAKIAEVKSKSMLSQWKNTDCVKKWFSELKQKHIQTFIQFDFQNFYPSITKELLEAAIEFAEEYTEFSEQEKEIIFEARKSILYSQNNAWTKRNGDHGILGRGRDLRAGGAVPPLPPVPPEGQRGAVQGRRPHGPEGRPPAGGEREEGDLQNPQG
jgi:hypothetical protein